MKGNGNGIDEDPYLADHVHASRGAGIGIGKVDNRNQITTPMFALLVVVMAISLAVAIEGLLVAQQAKTEARVALNHSEELKVVADENKVLIEVLGLKSVLKKDP